MKTLHHLQRWLSPLRHTPLHPQWLVLRTESSAREAIRKAATGRVLDIGCGNRWAERCLPASAYYVGLDYPATISKGYAGRADVMGDGQSLPFAADSFDTVILMDVLEHLPHPVTALAESRRVLKADGALLLQVPFLYPLHDQPHDFQRWSEHGLMQLFSALNFKVQALTRHGHPLETSAALLAIALAHGLLEAGAQKRPSMLLAPLILMAIPLVNLGGWVLAKLFPASSIMPLAYRVLVRKQV